MFRKIALTLFLLITAAVIAILAIAGTRPATYHVERSAVMTAPPQVVYGIVNDFHRWPDWSPWQHLDPAMKTTIQGSGVGAGTTYSWVGNNDAGEGSMAITESTPANHIAMKLEFVKPFKSSADVNFRLVPEGDGTRITWAMDGNNNFMSKVMCMFVSMDSMIGKDFDSGLANLKRVSEAPAASSPGAAADSTGHDFTATAKH